MMCHLYFSRYNLFNSKYVHIVITNTLHLNTDFFSFFFNAGRIEYLMTDCPGEMSGFCSAIFRVLICRVVLGC